MGRNTGSGAKRTKSATTPTLDDITMLRAWRDSSLYRLVFRASRAERMTTLERLHALGWSDVSLADTGLLANLDTAGSTITALARRSGITRQAASQQIATLERQGLVQRMDSPADARAAIVIQTERGRQLLADAIRVVGELEEEYTALIGATTMAAVTKGLTKLLAHIDPAGALGTD